MDGGRRVDTKERMVLENSKLTCLSCSSARRLLSATVSKLAASKALTVAESMSRYQEEADDNTEGCCCRWRGKKSGRKAG